MGIILTNCQLSITNLCAVEGYQTDIDILEAARCTQKLKYNTSKGNISYNQEKFRIQIEISLALNAW